LEALNPTSSIHAFIEPFVVAKIKSVSAESVAKEGTWDSFPPRDVLPRDLFTVDEE